MGFFGFMKRSKSVNINDLPTIWRAVGVRGESVRTEEQAMRLDVVYRCVDILSGTVASLPLRLQRMRGGIFKDIENSPINNIFNCEANERQTFFVLLQNAIVSLYLRGNAYILIQRDARGEVQALYLLDSNSVHYDVRQNTYTVSDAVGGRSDVYQSHEVIHLKNKTLDGGYVGVSTITYASRTLSISANSDEQTLDTLKRGNKMKGFLSGGNPVLGMGEIQDKERKKIADSLEQEIEADRSIMSIPGSVTFTPITISPADAQLLETRKFSPYSICRYFGVHPDMVFVERAGNYKSSENATSTFLTQTLKPLLTQIEKEFLSKLIPASPSHKSMYRVRFDLLDLYSADIKAMAEANMLSIQSGTMTPNEARKREGRDPVKGGDTAFISCNLMPIDGKNEEKKEETPEK